MKFPERADSTIEEVLEEFLAEQRRRLKPRTFSRYEDVIELIKNHLNGYGHSLKSSDKPSSAIAFSKLGLSLEHSLAREGEISE